MVKFRLSFDKDKETKWLNEMARQGYALTGFCAGFFSFDLCRPGEYVYQIDITSGMFRVSSDYREFMNETGVEIVCLWGMWVFLRKKASEGPFELYTDVESNIEHYTKIRKMFKCVAILEILGLMVELYYAMQGVITGIAGCFILGALTVLLLRETMRVNGILAELKERIGLDGERCTPGRGKLSGFLAAGLLLNAVGILASEWGPSYEVFKCFCQGTALIFFGIGMVHTFWRKRD